MSFKNHPVRSFVLLGFALLAISTAGAIFAHRTGSPQEAAVKPSPGTAAAKDVVCYGLVEVEGGVTQLAPLQTGRVTEVLVKEGQPVKKNDVLLKMDDTLAEQRLQEARADLANAKAQLKQAEALPAQHDAEIAQQKAVVEAADRRAQAAEKELETVRNTAGALKVQAMEKLIEQARAVLKAEREKLRQLELVNPQWQIDRAKAEVDAKQARVGQAKYALDQCKLTAPVTGRVLQVRVNPGSVISGQASQPVIDFAADDEQIIRAEVEQEFASDLKVGKEVTIRDENYKNPETKPTWKGTIKRISPRYNHRRSSSPDTMRISNNDVAVLEFIVDRIKPENPNQPPLHLGQRMRVIVKAKD